MRGIEEIKQYIDALQIAPQRKKLDRDNLDGELYPIADSLEKLAETTAAFYDFSIELANGNIEAEIDRRNFMAGPLKDLQSSLRHIVWQANRVAKGDYEQHMDFLGEFSDSFNEMIKQLNTREDILRENAELQLKMVEGREELLKKQLEQQVEHYHRIAEANHDLSLFRHDVKNHMIALRKMAYDEKAAEAVRYINDIMGLVENRETAYDTGNYMMDALLSEKISRAKKNGIEVDARVSVNRGLSVSDFDWCVILGNTMDNAIEACEKQPPAEYRRITIDIRGFGNLLNITISNTFSVVPELNAETGLYETTKRDKGGHGFGLASVRKAVEEYDGNLESEMRDGEFTLRILLCGITSKAAEQ